MAFEHFYGNDNLTQNVSVLLKNRTLPHAIILEGEKGLGKKTFARLLAAGLLCEQTEPPCEMCAVCKNVLEGNHPDVLYFETEKHTKDNFKIDTFIIYEVKYKKDVSNNVIHTKDDGTELEDNKYIEKITYDSTGNYTTTVLPYGTVKTPNGVNVSETTSYLKITFTVKNLFDKQNCKLEDAVQAVVKEIN